MMDLFWKFTDYFMDFQKVRNFQEFCGLKERAATRPHKSNVHVDQNANGAIYHSKKLDDECDEVNEGEPLYEYEPGSKQSYYDKKLRNKKLSSADSDHDETAYEVTNLFLYYMFRFGSVLGHEIFYITFIPCIFWNIDPFVARKMVVVWVVTMYIGQALKDIIQWPRPHYPPVFKLERRVAAEYGIPSTHAVAGTILPFSFLMAMYGRYEFPLEIGIVCACSWCMLVGLSRLYVGMHSILDVMAGTSIAAVYLWLGWPFMDMVEEYTMTSKYAPAIIIISHFLLGVFYPSTKHYSTSRGDTVIILGAGAGIHVATWLGYQYGFNYGPVGELPYVLELPSAASFSISTARALVGLCLLFLVRSCTKYMSLVLTCWLVGAPRQDPSTIRRKDVEITYKFITYAAVGFSALLGVPVALEAINLTHN